MLQNIFKLSKMFLWFMITLSSCSLTGNTQEGKGKFNIRVWGNHTPEFLAQARDDQFILNIANENVVEFDMKNTDNYIYLLYTTDKKIQTAKKANQVINNPLLQATITPHDWIEEYTLEEDDTYDTIIYRRAQIDSTGKVIIQDPVVHQKTTSVKKGVWVRLFKGTVKNNKVEWEILLATETPMVISSPKIAISLTSPSHITASIVAITNNSHVMVFDDRNMDGTLDIVSDNLLNQTYTSVGQINTWNEGNKVFISGVADRNLFTGYFQNMQWFMSFNTSINYNIKNMTVDYKSTVPYASWYNEEQQQSVVAVYDNKTSSYQKWLIINTFPFMKHPKIFINNYQLLDIPVEDVLFGATDQTHLYFQLFKLKDFKSSFLGPIITDWNEVFDFLSNDLGQIVYVRSNYDQRLIFAGLNSIGQWEPIQISSPPPVFIHPQSALHSTFINDRYTITAFKQISGSIYLLAGIN